MNRTTRKQRLALAQQRILKQKYEVAQNKGPLMAPPPKITEVLRDKTTLATVLTIFAQPTTGNELSRSAKVALAWIESSEGDTGKVALSQGLYGQKRAAMEIKQ